ncbi:PASTA domain-containing protein [Streptomyces sp. NPDC088387]|uniref:PASTA domain-containing protein n=1 Tax=Streptomyces sp. NPDC088387 TaxID=3365859 RepID=UPI0038183F22
MRTRTTAAALAAVALLTLTACGSGDDTGPGTPDTTAEDAATTEAETDAPADTPADDTDDNTGDEAEAESAELPDLTGQDLQEAQDTAQAAGFYVLDDQDASGQERLQIMDRNWTVCRQEPAAGTHSTDTPVVLYAVKDDETC